MTGIRKTELAVYLAVLGLLCPISHALRAQDDDADDSQIELIIEFISDADRETRATGLDYVRTEVPGEAATRRFADLLPKLGPDAQVDLLDALGDRGDTAARPAVMALLTAANGQTRAAALKTLGALGGADEVPLLAGWASSAEQTAARQSLIRLKGEQANAAIVKAMGTGGPDVRARLLAVLAARGAREALPTVLESVNDPDAIVRLAALEALRFLADEKNTAALVGMVKEAKDNAQQQKAELTLLVVCSRGGQACAEAIIEGLEDADAPSRIILLRALARAGGPEALEAIANLVDDEAEAVGDEAVRMLAGWPDDAVKVRLLEIAKSTKSDRRQVLALRGLVRLASPVEGNEGEDGEPADVKMLGEVLKLADRPAEKRLVLGVLGGATTPDALKLAASALKDAKLADDAGLAAVLIAEAIENGDKEAIRTAMGNVKKNAKSKAIIDRADKVVKSL